MRTQVSITQINSSGVTIEDEDLYQIFVRHDQLPMLFEKLSIAMSLDADKFPLGSPMHPGCVIEEILDAQ